MEFPNGFQFVPIPEEIRDEFEERFSRVEATFDRTAPKDYPGISPMERFVSEEETSSWYRDADGNPIPQVRNSYFISPRWQGPFGDDAIWLAEKMKGLVPAYLLETGHSYQERPWAAGVHRYSPIEVSSDALKSEGLHEHLDVDVVTILYSNGPLEGFIDGTWQTVVIPEGHVMLFIGLLGATLYGGSPLLHRVPLTPEGKTSFGIFIGPDFNQPINELTEMTVGDFYQEYFQGGAVQTTNLLIEKALGKAIYKNECKSPLFPKMVQQWTLQSSATAPIWFNGLSITMEVWLEISQ